MKRQFAAALCAAALSGAVALAALSPFAAAQPKSAKVKADGDRPIYATIKDLMESIVDPSADVIWNAVGTVADKQGVKDMAPKTPEEWADVRRAAVRLIEGGNMLMIPGREAAPAGVKSETPGVELEPPEITALIKKKRKSFDAFAKALQGLGSEALRASEAKNADLLIEIGGRMEEVCESCHKTFWYPLDQAASRSN
jgi:thiamine pyrophosphate-dependent acetolactate synthase large subunit-like protein